MKVESEYICVGCGKAVPENVPCSNCFPPINPSLTERERDMINQSQTFRPYDDSLPADLWRLHSKEWAEIVIGLRQQIADIESERKALRREIEQRDTDEAGSTPS